MVYYTIEQLNDLSKRINDRISKFAKLSDPEAKQFLAAEVVIDDLLSDIKTLDLMAERYIGNLERVRRSLKNCGFPGNSCGVVQGINEIEILNGRIEAQQRLLPRLIELLPAF